MHINMMDFDVIFVAGPQGSGKGTQGKKLAARLGFLFWEMGATLREILAEDTPLSHAIKMIDHGTLLSDETIIEVLKLKLPGILQNKGLIIDGIPRRLGQAQFVVEFFKEHGKTKLATIFIDLPREESIRRLLLRAQHESRVDDTPGAIETRFRYYDEVMKPAMDYLKTETTFILVDGTPSVDEVAASIDAALGIQ
jgi:adenylate kinase